MPVIRIDTTTPTMMLSPETRVSLLAKLKDEIGEKTNTAEGPVVFEIPMGSECLDILVVWEEWLGVRSEDRTALILEAYGDRQATISQALGVTYEEAVQQQLLPYAVVSVLEENPEFASKACSGDLRKVQELVAKIRKVKRENGGIVLPDGRIELRFPDRTMAKSILKLLLQKNGSSEFLWTLSN
jgi:hypothetical protein